jgi:acetyl-CoA carboxylase carboxyl transferase subunit alpha
LGGAHRDAEAIAQNVKHSIIKNLKHYESFSKEEVYNDRKARFLKIGRDKGFTIFYIGINVGAFLSSLKFFILFFPLISILFCFSHLMVKFPSSQG